MQREVESRVEASISRLEMSFLGIQSGCWPGRDQESFTLERRPILLRRLEAGGSTQDAACPPG